MSLYSIENAFLRLKVSGLGAELQSIFDPRRRIEYLWQGDPRYWSGRAPVLFPIVGRVRNGNYRHRDRIYAIESPHGFAKGRIFQVERRDSGAIRFVLDANDETLEQYPFRFRFAVEYVLDGPTLQVGFDVENRDMEELPFSLGFHPAFRVPLRSGAFEEHRLVFEEEEHPEQWTLAGSFLSGNRIPFRLKQGRILPLSRSLFENDAIILDGLRKKSVSLLDANGSVPWTVHFDDFRCLAIWQPAGTNPPFLCLETWSGLPDLAGSEAGSLDRKPGIRSVQPGESYRASLQIDFEEC